MGILNKMLDELDEEISELKDIIETHRDIIENNKEREVIKDLEHQLASLINLKDTFRYINQFSD